MAGWLKKIILMFTKTALVGLSVLIALLIMGQIVLLMGLSALNAGAFQKQVQEQVANALDGTGYSAIFQKLGYDPARGFTFYDIKISDAAGEWASADQLSFGIAYSKLLWKNLEMKIGAHDLLIARLPLSEAKRDRAQAEPSVEPFELPDIYVTQINVSDLKIHKLQIAKAVGGADIMLSPEANLSLKVDDNSKIGMSLTLEPGGISEQTKEWPKSIELGGWMSSKTLDVNLEKLAINADQYQLAGQGQCNLGKDGLVSVDLSGRYADLTRLTDGYLASTQFNLTINGQCANPDLQMTGYVDPASLHENGLERLNWAASAKLASDAISGKLDVATEYQGHKVELSASAAQQGRDIVIEKLSGTAPKVDIGGNGRLSLDNYIFDGAVTLAASDLSIYQGALPQNISGSAKASIRLKNVNDKQGAELSFLVQDAKASNLELKKANGRIRFDDVSTAWPQDVAIDVDRLRAGAAMTLEKGALSLSAGAGASYKLSLAAKGQAIRPVALKADADLSGLGNAYPSLRNIKATATIGKSQMNLSGAIEQNDVNVTLSSKSIRLSDLPVSLPDSLSKAEISGDVTMTGLPSRPVTNAHILAQGLASGPYKDLRLTADARHEGDVAKLTFIGRGSGIKTMSGTAELPLSFALDPFSANLNFDGPLMAHLKSDLDAGALAALALNPLQRVSGKLSVSADLGGTINRPNVEGEIVLKDGTFADSQAGIKLESIQLASSLANDTFILKSLSATDGESGALTASGNMSLTTLEPRFTLNAKNMHMPKTDMADGHIDAALNLGRSGGVYGLNGQIDVHKLSITVPASFQSKIPELNIIEEKKNPNTASTASPIALAVKINAPNQIFVRGWGLDAEFGGGVNVSGDLNRPLLDGTLASRRGRYEEFGKRFTITRANLRFQGEVPPSPYLDVEATTPAGDITAAIGLSGPVVKPAIAFSSTPALPQDEVLSRLLFGRDTSKITPFQAVQLAQTVRRLSGEGSDGGLDPLGLLRSATGLDDISVDTDASGETNVGVGKYLTDKVYLEVEKGKSPTSGSAKVQIELTPSVNVQTKVGQDAQAGGGIFWKKDY